VKVGVGLPISDPAVLLDWAQRAEDGPFSSLGLIDRLSYDNPEPLVALAAMAGATTRIRLHTSVLLAPLRGTALLAKQAATLDRMSGGRFTLGLSVGARPDDFHAAGVDLRTRGRRLDEQMATMRRLWSGEAYNADSGPIGPRPHRPGGPEVLFGGFHPDALARVTRWGDGYVASAPPEVAEPTLDVIRRQWRAAGRTGEPRMVAQVSVALGGPEVVDDSCASLARYYAFSAELRSIMLAGVLTSRADVRATLKRFADIGTDEVLLFSHARDPEQVQRLAEAL